MPSSSSSSSPPTSSRDPPPSGTWFPYRSAGDFDANLIMILIILICALFCAVALNATIRCLLRRHRRRRSPAETTTNAGKLTNSPTEIPTLPTLVFSAGMKMAGAEAECAICLSEFVNGEGIRVLPRCKHGFHVKCIEGWLASRTSCPTCRSSCLVASTEKSGSVGDRVGVPPQAAERLPEV